MSPVHWHKLPIGRFIAHELRRDGFMPFAIGIGISGFLCGVVPSMGLTDEDRKTSVYHQQRMRTMKPVTKDVRDTFEKKCGVLEAVAVSPRKHTAERIPEAWERGIETLNRQAPKINDEPKMTRHKAASAKAVEAPTTNAEGAVQPPGTMVYPTTQASGSNAALRQTGERLQEEHAVGWKSSTSPVTAVAAATPAPLANGTKVLLASTLSGGSGATDCDSSATARALQKNCWGASEGNNGGTASGTSGGNILNESLENITQDEHSPAFPTAVTAEQTIPVTRGRSAAVNIDSEASQQAAVSAPAARVPVSNLSSTLTRARSLAAKLRAGTPASSLAAGAPATSLTATAVVINTELGGRPKHSPSIADRIIVRSCRRGTTSEQATSASGESAGGIIDETGGLVSAAPPAAVASAAATSSQAAAPTSAASSTGARITRVVLANGGDAASDPSVANERGRRAGGSERGDNRGRGRSGSRGNRGAGGGRKGGTGRRRGGGGDGGKEGGEDDEQDEDEDGDDGAEIGVDAAGGRGQIESLEDIQSRLQQVNVLSAKIDTAMLRVEDRGKGTTATDERGMEATAVSTAATAANIPPPRDSECRRRRVPTARLQQHLVEVQRNSRQRSAKKSDSRSQGGVQQHQHQTGVRTGAASGAAAGDSIACGSRGGAVEMNSSPPATVAGRGSRAGGGRMTSRKRRRSEAAVTSASGAGVVAAPAVDVGNTPASAPPVSAAEVAAAAAESVIAEVAATPVASLTPEPPDPVEREMLPPAREASVAAPPSITDAAAAKVRVAKEKEAEARVAEARAEGLRAADRKIAEAKAAAAEARANEARADEAVAANEAAKMEAQGEAVRPPTTTELTAGAVAGDDRGLPPPLDSKIIDEANSNALTSSTSGATAPSSSSPVGVAVTTFWDAGAGRQQVLQQEKLQEQQKQQQKKQQQKRREAVVSPANGTTRTHQTRSCGGGARAQAESLERAARAAEAAAAAAEAAEIAARERARRREESRAASEARAVEAKARAAEVEAMKWEECVDESEAFVTAMLASVVRSLAEGPKTETELDQSVRSDMDAGRAAAGLPVADWSESHMVNVRLVVDVLIALGLVRSDYNTVEQACGWPMDVHPPSEAHGAPAPCFCSSVMRRAVARHTKMSAPSLPDAHLPLPPPFAVDPFQLGIPWNPAAAPDGGGIAGGGASFRPPVGNAAVYGVPGQVLATVPGAMAAAVSSGMPAGGSLGWIYAGVDTGQGLPAKAEMEIYGMASGVVADAANTQVSSSAPTMRVEFSQQLTAEVQSVPTATQGATVGVEPVTFETAQAAVQPAHVPTAQEGGYLPAQHGEASPMPPPENMASHKQQGQCRPQSTLPRLPGFRSDTTEPSAGLPEAMPAAAIADAGGGSGAASQDLPTASAEHSATIAGKAASSYGGSGGASSSSSSLSPSAVAATAAALPINAPRLSSSPADSSSPLGEALSAKTAAMPVSSVSGEERVLLRSSTLEAGNGGFMETSASGTMQQWGAGAGSGLAPTHGESGGDLVGSVNVASSIPRLDATTSSATSKEGGGAGGSNALSSRATACSAAVADVTATAAGASIADGQASTHQAPTGLSLPRLAIPATPPPKRVGVAEALMMTGMTFEGVFSPTEERRKLAPLYNINNNDDGSNHGDPSAAAAAAGAVDDDGGSSSEAINVAAMELDVLDSPPPSGSCESVTAAVGADVASTWGGVSGVNGGGGTDTDGRDAKASLYARFLRDPAGVVVPTPDNTASATATPVTAAVAAATAMAASTQGDVTDASPEFPLEVVALGEDLSDEAKALAEEGLFDLVSEAWGDETTDRAHAYVEDALPYLPIDARAFELAVEGKLEPGGELETSYGKPAVEMLHLWLHLKSDSWVKWRDAQARGVSAGSNATGSNGGGNDGSGGSIGVASIPSSYSISPNDYNKSSNSGGGGGNGRCGVPKVSSTGGVFSASGARKGPGGRNSGGRSSSVTTSKSSGRAKAREGKSSTASGSSKTATGGGGTSGSASSRGNRQKYVRYRLEGEQDRYLADWEEPARRALKLEMEVARLALCEEAVLRDLLRRCGISLAPGYARAGAIDKLRGRKSSNNNGKTVGVRAQGRGGAAASAAVAAAATTVAAAETRMLQYTAQASIPGRSISSTSSVSSASGAVGGSAGKISGGGSLGGGSDRVGRPKGKGKTSRGGLRRQSSVGRPRTKSSKRKKGDGSLEDFASSDDDRGSFSDSSQSSHRYRRPRSSPGGWDRYSTGENGISTDATVPPSLRGFTPGLTAAEALRLAKQHASPNAVASCSSIFQQQQPLTSAVNVDGDFHTDDRGVRKGAGGSDVGNAGGGNGGGIAREDSGNSRFNGAQRRSDWTMLTPHIRRPPQLLRGTRGPWRSSTGGVGSGGGVGGWNGHGGGNGGIDLSGCGGPGNGGGGSSLLFWREGESVIFGPSSSSSSSSARGSRRKSGLGSCGGGGSYEDGDGGCGEGSGDTSSRERTVSPAELFLRGMPKAIPWSDVARQFAPINVSDTGGTHPPPSPVGSREMPRASSFPGSSILPSTTTTAAAASSAVTAGAAASVVSGDASRPSAVADLSDLVSSTVTGSTGGLTSAAVATTEVATSSVASGSSSSTQQLRISVPRDNNGVSMGSDAGSDVGGGGGRGIKLERILSQPSGGTGEIIAPTFWLVETRDEGAGSAAGLNDGDETSGEDTSDEAFERRHTEHLARMKEKIEAARRARELASPRPPPKKRAGSFSGGRSTSKSGTLSGAAATAAAAAAAATGGNIGGAAGGGGGVTWSQAGGAMKGSVSRKNSGGRKSRSSDSNSASSQRSRNRRGASGSPRTSLTAPPPQLPVAQVDASSAPARSLPEIAPAAAVATVAESAEPTATISTAETTNPSASVDVLASVAEANSIPSCAAASAASAAAASVAADGHGGRGFAEETGGEAIAPSTSSAARGLDVARVDDKLMAPLDVSTSGPADSGGGSDGLTATTPSVVAAGQAGPSAAGANASPDLLQPTPSRLPSLPPPTK